VTRMRRRRRRHHDRPAHGRPERGTALVEVTWLSLLLLVPLLYIVLAVFEVQRAAFGVSGAARAAGRAYVLAPTEADAPGRAHAAAALALGDQRLDGTGRVELSCRPDPQDCLAPGSVVTAEVSYLVALPLAPPALGEHAPALRVAAVHAVPYGSFRENRP
jgi:hypothetical protein